MKALLKILAVVTVLFAISGVAQASFDSFVIRNGASGAPTIQTNNTYVTGATEFIISQSGMKAALGSDNINGSTVGGITQLSITRYDNTARFSAGSGPAVAPYFNIWVTDGHGKYAVIANEPSNPDFQPLFTINGDGSHTYALSYNDLANKSLQVYETVNGGYGSTTTWVHNLCGNRQLTFADVASLQIAPPPVSYIQAGNSVSGGAPRELGTNVAYGFNWVFGDTLSNYVSGSEGYVVANMTAVPEPCTMAILGLGGLFFARKKK